MHRIRTVESAADLQAFMDLPHRLYRDDPCWVEPMRKDVLRQLSPDNPFRSYGTIRCFLLEEGGRVAGRVAAMVNRKLQEVAGEPVGMFGFFECEPRPEWGVALLDAAAAELKAQGVTRMLGPMNFSIRGEAFFQVDGFGSPPTLLMPYNHTAYPGMAEAAGMVKARDALAFRFPLDRGVPEKLVAGRRAAEAAGYRYRPIDLSRYAEETRRVHELFTRCFEDNWMSTPMSAGEFDAQARAMKAIVVPQFFQQAWKGDDCVGLTMAFPDYNVVFRRLHGRMGLMGLLKFLWYRRSIRQGRFVVLGTVPEARHRDVAWGLTACVFEEAVRRGYDWLECSWIWEDNEGTCSMSRAVDGEAWKRYRIYQKEL